MKGPSATLLLRRFDLGRFSNMRVLTRFVPAIVAASLVFTACGGGFDRQGSIDDLMEGTPSLTEEQAACIVDGIVDEFGVDRATSDDAPTEEEAAQLSQISQICLG